MTIKTIDTEQIKQNTDLRELAARYTELRKETVKELAGPCPKCGGNDRFHCTDEWFMCRQCHPKRGDAIEFFMWQQGVDFKGAVAMLTNAPMPATAPQTKRTPAPKHRGPQARPEDWTRGATFKVDQAHRRLLDDNDKEAEDGRAYLDSRGIEPHTWIAFNLGYTSEASLPGTEGKQTAPAIVIPWYRAGKVRAVRYRFLKLHEYTDSDDKERKEKQTALYGSNFAGALFGGQALTGGEPSNTTLIVCEGEINACSIWQAVKDQHVHVFSLGSESATIAPAFVDYAAKHARVLVWMDKDERAQVVMGALPGARGFKSPAGQDANDFLRADKLGGILLLYRWQTAPDRAAQEAVLQDAWDAAQVWPGADLSTAQVTAHIAKTMGITLGADQAPADMPTWRRALATLDADKTPTVAEESGVQNAA